MLRNGRRSGASNWRGFSRNVGYKTTSEWKEEIVYYDPSRPTPGRDRRAPDGDIPDGTTVPLSPDQDPREVFADWLIAGNPWFARNMVNRFWSWLLGRGIIQEPDDIRPDNPPANPELLAYLEKELVSSGYDLKHIFRLILNSRTYQLSSIPKTGQTEAAANFASYPLRRLDAEVLIDAMDQITGSTESYSSAIPEPYTFIPDRSAFHRAAGRQHHQLRSWKCSAVRRGTPGLESERNNRVTAAQKLWLLNSSQIQRKIEQSRMIQYSDRSRTRRRGKSSTAMYLTILSRFPTDR